MYLRIDTTIIYYYTKGTIDVSKVLPLPYGFSFLYLLKYEIKDTIRDSATAHSTILFFGTYISLESTISESVVFMVYTQFL